MWYTVHLCDYWNNDHDDENNGKTMNFGARTLACIDSCCLVEWKICLLIIRVDLISLIEFRILQDIIEYGCGYISRFSICTIGNSEIRQRINHSNGIISFVFGINAHCCIVISFDLWFDILLKMPAFATQIHTHFSMLMDGVIDKIPAKSVISNWKTIYVCTNQFRAISLS